MLKHMGEKHRIVRAVRESMLFEHTSSDVEAVFIAGDLRCVVGGLDSDNFRIAGPSDLLQELSRPATNVQHPIRMSQKLSKFADGSPVQPVSTVCSEYRAGKRRVALRVIPMNVPLVGSGVQIYEATRSALSETKDVA
jgi:hypothetical protein